MHGMLQKAMLSLFPGHETLKEAVQVCCEANLIFERKRKRRRKQKFFNTATEKKIYSNLSYKSMHKYFTSSHSLLTSTVCDESTQMT